MATMTWKQLQQAMFRRKTLAQAMQQESNDPGGGGGAGGGQGEDVSSLLNGGSSSTQHMSSSSSTSPTRRPVVRLARTLGALDLVLYGIGSSVGAGIYVLVGLGAELAGPAISLSFALCGCACTLTALCYAEFASRIPVTGSAFVYSYVAFGEFWAWLVAWNLTLGYGFTTAVVARACSDYVGDLLSRWSTLSSPIAKGIAPLVSIIHSLTAWPFFGREGDNHPFYNYTCSPLSMVVIAMNTWILLRGVKDSSRFNNIMTVLNVTVLSSVVLAGLCSGSVQKDNLIPFFIGGTSPNGTATTASSTHAAASVLQGSGLVFFAFIGFDMVASLSEEVIHPEKNMPIGIVGSLLMSTLIYVAVSIVVVGMAPIPLLGNAVPIVNALFANAHCTHEQQREAVLNSTLQNCLVTQSQNGTVTNLLRPWLAYTGEWVRIGAIFGLMASCFTSLMGQPRILYSMGRDQLLPRHIFASLDPITQVPRLGVLYTGAATALLACFCPLGALASLISLGTLMVFTFVDAGVLLLRLRVLQQHEVSCSSMTTTESLSNTTHYQSKQQVYNQVVLYVVTFAMSLLACALLGSHAPIHYQPVTLVCGLIAIWSVIALHRTQPCWVAQSSTINIATIPMRNGDGDEPCTPDAIVRIFECPGLPWIPLAGIASNAFMMGSLPLSSWFLCALWLLGGIIVYFSYGIHHSALNTSRSGLTRTPSPDAVPLLQNRSQESSPSYDADHEGNATTAVAFDSLRLEFARIQSP